MKYTSPWTPAAIKAFRKNYFLSQANLAILLDTFQQRIGEWERGTHTMKRPYSKLLTQLEDRLKPLKRTAGNDMEQYHQLILISFGVSIELAEKKHA